MLMPLEHQVVQKLHAVTGTGDRVRDLVDLQIMFSNSDIDLAATRCTCERLFAYRQGQADPIDQGTPLSGGFCKQNPDAKVGFGFSRQVAGIVCR